MLWLPLAAKRDIVFDMTRSTADPKAGTTGRHSERGQTKTPPIEYIAMSLPIRIQLIFSPRLTRHADA